MRQRFLDINFRKKSIVLINHCNTIINELQAQGYTLTVRQLFYQLVSRDLLANTQQNYKNLASTIDDARKAGFIDWNAIEDRTRFLRHLEEHDVPADFIATSTRDYRKNLARYCETHVRENQEVYIEQWVEKDALLGVIETPCLEWRVPYFACRGYASSSELYEAGQRFAQQARKGKRIVLLHIGDHDPSGIDMTRCNEESVNLLGSLGGLLEVRRLALNMDQIEEYSPPPNPAKESDSRYAGYCDLYGEESWELDALQPKVIDALIREAIIELTDVDQFEADLAVEREHKDQFDKVGENWDEIQNYLKVRHNQVAVGSDNAGEPIWNTPHDIVQQAADEAD